MGGAGVLEQWRQEFLDRGAVEVRAGRLALGGSVLAGGLVAGAVGLYLLVTPGSASFLPLAGLRVVGVVGVAAALATVPFGLRMLRSPRLIVRLDHGGLTPGASPPARWDEVQGADTKRIGGLDLATVRLDEGYWSRVRETDPEAMRDLERSQSVAGRDRVLLQAGAPGGGEAVMRLILWARERASSG